MQQTAFAKKHYKSHQCVGLPSDIIHLMAAKEALEEASKATWGLPTALLYCESGISDHVSILGLEI